MTSPFLQRHVGPSPAEQERMLAVLGYADMDAFLADVVPQDILDPEAPRDQLPDGCSEAAALKDLGAIASKNESRRSLIGLGYFGTATPALIKGMSSKTRLVHGLHPYQAEIAQGRLEALLNFQTLISELTGLPIANASLLDEATAAAEAMSLSFGVCRRNEAIRFLVDEAVLPQTWAVLQTRAEPLGIVLERVTPQEAAFAPDVFGLLLQLPGADGQLWDPSAVIAEAHAAGALVTAAIDPLAQTLITPVAAFGVDIAVGSAQRFGVPMGFGGPHACVFRHP